MVLPAVSGRVGAVMDIGSFFLFLAACVPSAATGALFPPGAWYRTLRKPRWTPPDRVFSLAWTMLYLLMAAAAARASGFRGAETGLALWALQMTFNTLWTPVFFGLHRMALALGVLAVLWVAVAATTLAFLQVDRWAAGLFLPCFAWVSFSLALNLAVVRLNPGPHRQVAKADCGAPEG